MNGQLFILPPLLVVLLFVAFKHTRPLFAKGIVVNDAVKKQRKASGRALVYLLIPIMLVWLVPPLHSGWLVIPGTILSILLAATVLLAVFPPPEPRFEKVNDLLLAEGPRGDSYLLWARRAVAGLFILIFGVVAISSAIGGAASPQQGEYSHADKPPAATTPVAPPSSAAPAPSPSKASPSATTGCGAPIPEKLDQPVQATFQSGHMEVCKDNTWQPWTEAAPDKVTLTAWTVQGGYGYGTIQIGDETYLIRTTKFSS